MLTYMNSYEILNNKICCLIDTKGFTTTKMYVGTIIYKKNQDFHVASSVNVSKTSIQIRMCE